jgi:hypothetical protein
MNTGERKEGRMALEDYMEPEVAVTAVVTAAIFSPQARKIIRRGAVYGMAGVLVVGDALSSFTRSVGHGFEQAKAGRGQKEPKELPQQGMQEPLNPSGTETTTPSPETRRGTGDAKGTQKPTDGAGG